MQGNYFVYILTNPKKTVLYVGITNDLERRLLEHKENRGKREIFAGRFYCYQLLHYEHYSDSITAISREKELKGWSRMKKDSLIRKTNPKMNFLNSQVVEVYPKQDASLPARPEGRSGGRSA